MPLPYIATLFFTLSSFLTSSLPRKAPEQQPAKDHCQDQMTIARTRRPSPEPDDRPRTRRPLPEPDDRYQKPDDDRSNNQPANTTNDSINRLIELDRSFDIGPSPN